MPHLVLEYSANLEPDIDISGLLSALHAKAVSIDALPTGGIRMRAARREKFMVGDGDPDNGFISATLRLGKGRSLDMRKELGQTLFGVLSEYVEDVYQRRPLALSFEVQEIDPETRWNRGNIREYMAKRANE